MYYATAGQQATQPPPGTRPGFPPMRSTGAPPGFVGRAADPNDFPALGSHSNSNYAQQTSQPPSQSSQPPGMYLPQGLAPPPPPGIGGSLSPSQNQNQQSQHQSNGSIAGDDFPVLGGGLGLGGGGGSGSIDGKDRIGPHSQPYQQSRNPNQLPQTSSPPLANGSTSHSQSTSATPSSNPPHPQSTGTDWSHLQQPPIQSQLGLGGMGSGMGMGMGMGRMDGEPIPLIRPVQQILSSPVDQWGLQALLYEIKESLGKQRGSLLFGEELGDMGLDIAQEAGTKLYPTFVTPWVEPGQLSHTMRIEEPFTMPTCYNVHAPALQSKLPNFSEDTLFYAFYTSPQDLLQIEVAEELFNRGWRYHTELQIWLTSPSIPSAPLDGTQSWQRGPFVVFDPRTFTRQKTPDEFMVDSSLLEATRPAGVYVKELESEGLINGR